MRTAPWTVVAVALLATAPAAQTLPDVEECRDFVLEKPAEQTWDSIPWHTTFGSALLAADAEDRPVLLWAMNGHPLGCT